jgi:hypothetical protein
VQRVAALSHLDNRFCYAVRMTLDAVRRCLLEQRELLREYGVSALYVFGSVVRGHATEESDVDLLVEFARPIGLIGFIGLQRRLAVALGHPVDLVTPAGLKPQLKARILREAVRAA